MIQAVNCLPRWRVLSLKPLYFENPSGSLNVVVLRSWTTNGTAAAFFMAPASLSSFRSLYDLFIGVFSSRPVTYIDQCTVFDNCASLRIKKMRSEEESSHWRSWSPIGGGPGSLFHGALMSCEDGPVKNSFRGTEDFSLSRSRLSAGGKMKIWSTEHVFRLVSQHLVTVGLIKSSIQLYLSFFFSGST